MSKNIFFLAMILAASGLVSPLIALLAASSTDSLQRTHFS
jgi:hypothetical protein